MYIGAWMVWSAWVYKHVHTSKYQQVFTWRWDSMQRERSCREERLWNNRNHVWQLGKWGCLMDSIDRALIRVETSYLGGGGRLSGADPETGNAICQRRASTNKLKACGCGDDYYYYYYVILVPAQECLFCPTCSQTWCTCRFWKPTTLAPSSLPISYQ